MSPVQGLMPRAAKPKLQRLASRHDHPRRLACDRCHSLKEKCIFNEDVHQASCLRCSRLNKPCATSRTRHGGGRPRKAVTTPTQPQAGAEFVWHGDRISLANTTSPAFSGLFSSFFPVSTPDADAQNQQNEDVEECSPPSPEPSSRWQLITRSSLPTSLSDTTVLIDRTPEETRIILNLLKPRAGFMRPFVLGESFLQHAQNTFCYGVYAAPEVLLSAHLALIARWRITFQRRLGRLNSDVEGTDYAHCARAVRTLRQTHLGRRGLKVLSR